MSAKVDSLYRFDRIAPVVGSPEGVGAEAVQFFQANGFLAVADVLSANEIVAAQTALSDLVHGRIQGADDLVQPEPDQKEVWATLAPEDRGDLVRKLFKFVDFVPVLKEIGEGNPIIQSLLTKLVGEPCHMIQDMALLKPPFVGTEKPWHQDAAYFGWGPPEKLIGIWIALDPATAENGCMHVLPGTHHEGPVPHAHIRDCQIPDANVQVDRDVMVPLAPGGILFFSALLHHGTPPNSSPARRRALQFHYAASSAVKVNVREHATMFFDGDAYAGCRGQWGVPVSAVKP